MNPINKIKNILLPLINSFREFDTNFSLSIDDIDIKDKHKLVVNGDSFTDLYCVDLAGAGEAIYYVNEIVLNSLYDKYNSSSSSFFVWTLVKDGPMQKNLIFTSSKDMAMMIASALNTRMLHVSEIINMLLVLYFHNEYEVDFIDRTLKQKINIESSDFDNDPLFTFRNIIRNASFANNDVAIYQAISFDNSRAINNGYKEKMFQIAEFYNTDFRGVLYTKVNLSKKSIDSMLSLRNLPAIVKLNNDAMRIEELKKDNQAKDRVSINQVLMVFEDSSQTAMSTIEKYAYSKMMKVYKSRGGLIKKTPILSTNSEWDRVVDKKFLINYIGYKNKLDSDQPHLCGYNQSGAMVNFGFKKATATNSNAKPHPFLIGTSGSGKTKTANFIVTQLLGWDIEKETIEHFDECEFRLFDIKQSFYYLVKRIKNKYPDLVQMIDFNKNYFKYNILDCDMNGDKVVESDLTFASTLISLVLSNGGKNLGDVLTSNEESEFTTALRGLYNSQDYGGFYLDNIKQTHRDVYDELIALGYKGDTLLKEIQGDKYEFLRKPLLFSLMSKLEERSNLYEVARKMKDKEIVDDLIRKLKAIDSKEIFSYPTNLNLKIGKIIYFNLDSLLGDADFSPIVFAMQNILSKNDKKKQRVFEAMGKKNERPLIFYMYEEARNLFDNKLFKEEQVFERIINEWRSDDMVFFPITQEPEHIPASVIKGFEIKFILTYGTDEEERAALINYLGEKLDLGPKRKELIEGLPKYTMAALYADGAFSIRFPITPEHVRYFEQNAIG